MRTPTRWLGFSTIVLTLAGAPVLANPGKGGQSTTPKVQGPKAATTTTTSGAPKTTKGGSGKTTTTTTTNGKSHSPKTTTTSTTSAKTSTTTPTTTTSSGGTSTGGTSTPTDTWKPTNAVSAKVSTKPSIMTKVNNVLPTGTDLNNATLGFKNFGQFVAAVNVSNNLRIPFADLKAAMTGIDIDGLPVAPTGTTGTSTPTTMSLGQAIHKVAPTVDSETEAQKALTQANQQINASTTSTTTTKKTKS